MWQVITQHLNNLRRFKQSFMVEFIGFICSLLLFVSFIEFPVFLTRIATIKLLLNPVKFFTMSLCYN